MDVALRVRASLEESGSMVVKRLDVARQVLVASPELLIRQGTPTTLADLARMDSIAMSAPDGRATGSRPGRGRAAGGAACAALCGRRPAHPQVRGTGGYRNCWLPDYMCHDEIHTRRLVRVLPDWAPAVGIVHAVFPSRRGLSAGGAAFSGLSGGNLPGRSSQATRPRSRGAEGLFSVPGRFRATMQQLQQRGQGGGMRRPEWPWNTT